jgi:hypothetical protein
VKIASMIRIRVRSASSARARCWYGRVAIEVIVLRRTFRLMKCYSRSDILSDES